MCLEAKAVEVGMEKDSAQEITEKEKPNGTAVRFEKQRAISRPGSASEVAERLVKNPSHPASSARRRTGGAAWVAWRVMVGFEAQSQPGSGQLADVLLVGPGIHQPVGFIGISGLQFENPAFAIRVGIH